MAREWSRQEDLVTVADYFAMLESELRGEAYNKSAHNESLRQLLDGRSPRAVEDKHMNISAILRDAGHPFIDGYKPYGNYQSILAEIVLERIGLNSKLRSAADKAADAVRTLGADQYPDAAAAEVAPPTLRDDPGRSGRGFYQPVPRHFDYPERDAMNRRLGEAGEAFIMGVERSKLRQWGREDLVSRIEWTSRDRGDGAGYDIQSFDARGEEHFIEVKTTNLGKLFPFIVTQNEIAFSESRPKQYRLVRLFHFARAAQYFALPGAVSKSCRLTARTFRAQF